MDNTARFDVALYDRRKDRPEPGERTVVRESALVIGVNGAANYTIMRTPGHDRELAVGFLFTEGIIERVADVMMLSQCPDTPDSIVVRTSAPESAAARRNLVVNSSCGLCGRADLDALLAALGRVECDLTIDRRVLYELPDAIRAQQGLFEATGATHAAALFDEQGCLFVTREDVGRHNAVDKVLGHALLSGRSTERLGLFLSGRTSLELIVKAARAKVPVVASVSAPTDAAIEVARKVGITTAGFARGTAFTVYSHGQRIA